MYRELVRSIEAMRTKPTPGQVAEIHARALRRIMDLRERFGDLPEGLYSTVHVGSPELPFEEAVRQLPRSISKELLEWLCWNRYRRPLWQITLEDAAGDREASKKIERIIADGNRLRYGEGIASFKSHLDHSALLRMGFPLGLDKLTAEELADCFEAVCPCEIEHTADGLKKQRKRLLADIEAAKKWEENPPERVLARVSGESS